MSPTHHPHPETLISYASGTLASPVACVVTCHLSMCAECADQVRWLERLGGVMLSRLETDESENEVIEDRAIAQGPTQTRPWAFGLERMTKVGDALLPLPLLDYLGSKDARTPWKPDGSGGQERAIVLPKASGSVKLLQVSPGERLPQGALAVETEVALVLQGACQDGAGYYVRGDIIEWSDDQRPPMVSGEVDCVCLIAEQASG